MTRVYENSSTHYDYLAGGKCLLVQGNTDLGNVVVNPDNENAHIFFEKDDLKNFCAEKCPCMKKCEEGIKQEILNLIL